jgi:uncharacterized protein YyaL (SSP411 family)
VVASRYLPFAVTIDISDRHRDNLAAMMPFIASMQLPRNGAFAYVCRNFTCEAPVRDAAALKERLA